MIVTDINNLAEVLADDYDFDMELTEIGVLIYRDDLTLDDMITIFHNIDNLVVEYQKDYIVLSLS